jgi:hypothetical protein
MAGVEDTGTEKLAAGAAGSGGIAMTGRGETARRSRTGAGAGLGAMADAASIGIGIGTGGAIVSTRRTITVAGGGISSGSTLGACGYSRTARCRAIAMAKKRPLRRHSGISGEGSSNVPLIREF